MEYQKSKRSNKKLYKRSDKRTKKRLNRRPDKRTKKKYKREGGADAAPVAATAAASLVTTESSEPNLYIIRHGLSCANAKKYESKGLVPLAFHKILDPRLTKSSIEKSTGYEKSGLHGEIKKIIFNEVNPDRKFVLCCSTLLRSQETCYHMFKRYLDHKNCLNKSIHILPYCNEKFNKIDKYNQDNKPDPKIWGITGKDKKITKIQERVFKNYETLFKTKEPRKKFVTDRGSIKLEDRNIFNLDYITDDFNVSETGPDREEFKKILKEIKIKIKYLTGNPIIIVVTHSNFMKGELKIPVKPKNNSIHKFTMKIEGDSGISLNYEGNDFDGFDNSHEKLGEQVKICETN